jgi:hypothetical protein
MSIDEPAPGSGSRGELPAGGRRVAHASERSYLSLVPWRNFRRVVLLIVALMGVVALKKSAGGLFSRIIDSVTPQPAPARHVPATTVHLQPGPPPK